MARVGDFVTAKLLGRDTSRQGVIIQFKKDGVFIMQGMLSKYTCEDKPILVSDNNLNPETLEFVKNLRKELGIEEKVE